MLAYTVPALILIVATLLAFWYKAPPIPPAPSADKVSIPFFKGLKDVLTNLSFWVLLVVWGCSAGLFNALLTLLAQILCPFGYSDVRNMKCLFSDCYVYTIYSHCKSQTEFPAYIYSKLSHN